MIPAHSILLASGQFIDLEYMRWWQALVLMVALAVPVVLLGHRSLAGLGPIRRWVAVGARLAVLLLMVLLLAGLQLRREKLDLEVMVLADISDSTTLYKGHPGKSLGESVDLYLMEAMKHKGRPDDRLGLISFNQTALIDMMSTDRFTAGARAIRESGGGTDIAGAINLGLASLRNTTLHRLLLISDGNQTAGGNLAAAIAAAAAQGVPIDVMPLRYEIENEVLLDRLVSGKSWRRENEPFTLDVFLRSTNATKVTGTLTVFHVSESGERQLAQRTVSIEPAMPRADGSLEPRLHVEHVPVPELRRAGVHEFRAVFTDPRVVAGVGGARADTRADNNTGTSFVIVHGKGRILLVDNVPRTDARGTEYLVSALREGGLEVDRIPLANLPSELLRLQNYDAILLANVPRSGVTDDQDKMLAAYVHEMGGGLVMLGGEDSFGAGGWGGSKVEEVLPVTMDVPAQRQMPKGALVLCMHSCEMPNGNYWGEQCALKAVEALSARDEVGVVSYGGGGAGVNGAQWDFPLQEKRTGAHVTAAIKKMMVGDAPSYDDFLQLALNGSGPGQPGLIRSNAARKHVIIISDGDCAPPTPATLAAYRKAGVTVSTVPVFPHVSDPQGLSPTLSQIAKETGGRAYPAINNNPNQLPQIFIKEAVTVRRSLIQSDNDGIPVKREQSTDPVRGIDRFAPVFGYVLTGRKPGDVALPLTVAVRDKDGKSQVDPLLAHWQAGLGKAAAFTSDAHNRWAAQWVGTPAYAKFWTQLVRSVQRGPMSTDFDVQVTRNGDKARITVEALGKDSAFANFLNLAGTVSGPDGKQDIRLVQSGPGTYSAEFETRREGNYVAVVNYRKPGGGGEAQTGWLMSGVSVTQSPEMRSLRSDDNQLRAIARQTRGRVLTPWDAQGADLFSRQEVRADSTPLPVRDALLRVLIVLLILDVAVRRIAWDWNSLKRGAARVRQWIGAWTLSRKVDSEQTLDALKRVRQEVAQTVLKDAGAKAAPSPPADPAARFEARGVEGDLTQVVGGATDKPIPPPPKPTGGPTAGADDHTGSLLEAKRRAREKIKQKEEGDK